MTRIEGACAYSRRVITRTTHAHASWKSNTEAVRVFQGFSGQRLLVKNESFLYDLEYFRLRVACEFLF